MQGIYLGGVFWVASGFVDLSLFRGLNGVQKHTQSRWSQLTHQSFKATCLKWLLEWEQQAECPFQNGDGEGASDHRGLVLSSASSHGLTMVSSNSFLEKCLFKSFRPFLNQVSRFFVCFFLSLNCVSSLYILDISQLSDIWYANIFFHLVGYLFIVLIFSFAVQKVFSSPTYLFLLLLPMLLVSNPKIISKTNVKESMFPLSFKVSGLTYKSLTYFELIFVSGIR